MGFIFGDRRIGNTIDDIGEKDTMHDMASMDRADSALPASDEVGRYDGGGMADVFENYENVKYGEGYVPVHFLETRKYLQQVRDQKRAIGLLENRIGYRREAGMGASDIESELEDAKEKLKITIANVSEEISKVGDVNQELVLTRRYIDAMSWDDIARTVDFKMRTVQKCHGKALPRMEEILLADGLITMEGDGGEDEYSS